MEIFSMSTSSMSSRETDDKSIILSMAGNTHGVLVTLVLFAVETAKLPDRVHAHCVFLDDRFYLLTKHRELKLLDIIFILLYMMTDLLFATWIDVKFMHCKFTVVEW